MPAPPAPFPPSSKLRERKLAFFLCCFIVVSSSPYESVSIKHFYPSLRSIWRLGCLSFLRFFDSFNIRFSRYDLRIL